MSKISFNEKLNTLSKATESFRATKKKLIARICSVGVKYRILKYPALVAAALFILLVDIAFYICLFVLVDKKRAVGVALVLIGLIGFIVVLGNYNNTDKIYSQTRDTYTEVASVTWNEEQEDTSKDAITKDIKTSNKPREWYELISVDFDGLEEVNEDIIGWIYFENEDISYPVLQGESNDVYLKTSYMQKSSKAGSIFLDSKNSSDFEDFNTLIYGHNMRDKSMFGKLSYYREDTAYYNGHEYFQILTPDMKYRYEIISFKSVKEDNPIYDLDNIEKYTPDDYVQKLILNNSMIGMGLTAYEGDHFVTLSTCTSGENRFIVCAFRIAEHDNK